MPEQLSDRLYQFNEVVGKMNLPMHQYLLATEPSIMFATGSYDQAEWILPEIAEILGDRPLKYLFLSHFESDECGGVWLFKKRYPRITVVCSGFLARELPGFGYRGRVVVGEEGKGFQDGELSLKFFRYPAEVHLRDGLLCYERNSGTFYSSDLMFRPVNGKETSVDGDWAEEVATIDAGRIPDETRRERLKADLLQISPRLVAVGHGTCVRCPGSPKDA